MTVALDYTSATQNLTPSSISTVFTSQNSPYLSLCSVAQVGSCVDEDAARWHFEALNSRSFHNQPLNPTTPKTLSAAASKRCFAVRLRIKDLEALHSHSGCADVELCGFGFREGAKRFGVSVSHVGLGQEQTPKFAGRCDYRPQVPPATPLTKVAVRSAPGASLGKRCSGYNSRVSSLVHHVPMTFVLIMKTVLQYPTFSIYFSMPLLHSQAPGTFSPPQSRFEGNGEPMSNQGCTLLLFCQESVRQHAFRAWGIGF